MKATCPYCGREVHSAEEEARHMHDAHPAVVAQRLRDAGLHDDADRYMQGVSNG